MELVKPHIASQSGRWLIRHLDRFPYIMAAHTAKIGLIGGLAFGLIQDGLTLAKGGNVAYLDLLMGASHREKLDQRNGLRRDW